jgi:iron complex outermembrane recepter protein
MRRKIGLLCQLGTLVVMGAISVTNAQARATEWNVDIDAGDLVPALKQLANQTGMQILFRPEDLQGRTSQAVRGEMSSARALSLMLGDSGVSYETVNGSTVILTPVSSIRVAALSNPDTASVPEGPDAIDSRNQNEEIGPGAKIPQILVRGARTLNADVARGEDDIQPYVILDAERIRRSGAVDLGSFIREQLTASTETVSNSQLPSGAGSASIISLRGLGASETLILVNGRRVSSFFVQGIPQQPDISAIPLSAVERVEVLPSSASGIFGGSATAGVVNIVLKKDFSGIDVGASFGNTLRNDRTFVEGSINGGLSARDGRFSVMVSGSYKDFGDLQTSEREFLRKSRETVSINNPSTFLNAAFPPLGSTTNIRSSTNAALTLKGGGGSIGSNKTFIPPGYAGVASDGGAALRANAGTYNLELADTAQTSGGQASILTAPTAKFGAVTIRNQFSDRFEGFLDLSLADNVGRYLSNGGRGIYTVTAASPINPFNQTIRVSTPVYGLDGEITTRVFSRRATGGLLVRFPFDWGGEFSYSWSGTKFSRTEPNAEAVARINAALLSGALNIFQDTSRVDFAAFSDIATTVQPVSTTVRNPAFRASGPLHLPLPGGPPVLTTLIEHRKEIFNDYFRTSAAGTAIYPSRHQSVTSGYAELYTPIVSDRNRLKAIHALDFQLAVRHDKYTTVGANVLNSPTDTVIREENAFSSTDPTVGLMYRPVQGLSLRASYAEGFLPPNVSQLVATEPSTVFTSNLTDPRRANEPVALVLDTTTGGNPDLRPESSQSYSIGLILQPAAIEGLRFSADKTKIRKRDNIRSVPLDQFAVDSELAVPGLFTRAERTDANDPQNYGVGPIEAFNSALINVSETKIDVLDLALNYEHEAWFGTFARWSFRGTRQTHLLSQVTPTSLEREEAGLSTTPIWKVNAGLSVDVRKWSFLWQSRFSDSYWLNSTHETNPSQASAKIRSQIYHDLAVEYSNLSNQELSASSSDSLLSGLTVRLGVRNVFNTSPPIDVTVGSGYSLSGDPRLANYYFFVGKHF